ncbi:MAG: hypothetical protein HUU02_01435 [Bacteroidetes bacterium]|nr:hypothetical protein [Bacteroidota bacterium]
MITVTAADAPGRRLNRMDPETKPQDPYLLAADQVSLLWSNRWRIIRWTFLPTIVAVLISLVLPKTYVASTTVLPDLDFLSGLKGRLAGLQDLAGDLGLGGGAGMSPSQLYPEIIVSETILKKVIYHRYQTQEFPQPVTLLEYFEYDTAEINLSYEQCLKSLRENMVSVSVDRKTTIITVTVEMPEPGLAADVANQITTELDRYQRNFRNSSAREQRLFLDTRLNDVMADLRKSEDAVRSFREKNRSIIQSPQLMLEQARLERDVTINNTIFLELKKQSEIVKLDEVKNTPVVSVLDTARAPAKKDRPRRMMIVLTVFVLSFFLTLAVVIGGAYSRQLENSSIGYHKFLDTLRSFVKEIPIFRKFMR